MVTREIHCQKIAEDRRSTTIDKVIKTIIRLIEENETISLQIIVNQSGVSESWFYKNRDFLTLIKYLENVSIDTIDYLKILETKLENVEKLIKRTHD